MAMDLASSPDIDAGLEHIRRAPTDRGILEMIVRRPAVDEREVLDEAELDLVAGLVGDTWAVRPSTRTTDGSAHPDMQLNVISARAIALLSPDPSRWALAGDQLFVDLDLSEDRLLAGTHLAIGTAVIEVTDQPHRGCAKFSQRFGLDALRLVNSEVGVALRLRGLNAKVVRAGTIRRGDVVAKA
jgi:hypothetical protein